MKKLILGVLIALLLIVVIGMMVLMLYGGSIIKKAVNTVGPDILGVPVTLQEAQFSLTKGRLQLTGLHVGNPKGFKTAALCDVGQIEVEVDLKSLLTDTIVIRRILVKEPQITYEQGLRGNNLGALLEQMGGDKEATPAPAAKDAEPGTKVVIDELTISGGKVKLSVTAAMGVSAPIALTTVSMKNIGREGGTEGLGMTDVVRLILGTVLKSVVQAVGGLGGVAVDGVKAMGAGAVKVGGGAVDAVKSLGSGKAAEGAKAMGQGAVQVGGAAVEGVRLLGKGMGKAISGVMGSGATTNSPAEGDEK